MPTVGFSMVSTISMTPKKVGKASHIFFIVAGFSAVFVWPFVFNLQIYAPILNSDSMENV